MRLGLVRHFVPEELFLHAHVPTTRQLHRGALHMRRVPLVGVRGSPRSSASRLRGNFQSSVLMFFACISGGVYQLSIGRLSASRQTAAPWTKAPWCSARPGKEGTPRKERLCVRERKRESGERRGKKERIVERDRGQTGTETQRHLSPNHSLAHRWPCHRC